MTQAGEQAEKRQEARLPLRVLQAQLARRAWGLDAYWLPRTDPFMSEYLPPEAERLAFLTGFEGSAGTLVFTAERAVLFVDGRYDLQARQQFATFPVPIEVLRIETTRPQDWLAEQSSLRTIGYDPALFSQEQVSRLEPFFKRHKKSFRAVEPNLVDALWTSRPGPSQEAIWEHALAWAGESSADKTARVCRILRDKGTGGFLFSLSDSIAWLTNKRGGDIPFTPVFQSYYALFEDGHAVWFVDEKRLTAQARRALDPRVQVVPPASFDAYWAARASCRLGVDPKSLSSRVYQTLADRLTLIDMPEPVQPLKAVKNATEQRAVREAHCQDGVALVQFLAWLEAHGPSTDEWACVEYLETCRRRNPNYIGPSFPTISGAGPNGAIVHYRVTPQTSRRLQDGDIYLVDSGGQYACGTTDVTRTVAIGSRPPPEAARRAFTLVLKGHIALARAVFPPGTRGSQLDGLARAPLWRGGGDYAHGTGHGVGFLLSVHESPPNLSPQSPSRLMPGMVLSNEPGFYREGAFGIRTENLMLVREWTENTAAGTAEELIESSRPLSSVVPPLEDRSMLFFETLTLAPIDRRLLEGALLNDEERAWLDAYHQRVLSTLAPRLKDGLGDDRASLAWCQRACEPLRPAASA